MKIISSILGILFPHKCAFCMRTINEENCGICDTCRNALPYANLRSHTKGEFFADCVSPLQYKDDVRKSLKRYKFSGKIAYCKTYAPMVLDCIEAEYGNDYDIITWVPVSKKRLHHRGYDQSKVLVEEICKLIDKKPTATLIKHKHVKAQSLINSAEKRKANICGVYTAINRELYEGKTVLLIDDIITSGSTMSECAKTLLIAGAKSVKAATVAKSHD